MLPSTSLPIPRPMTTLQPTTSSLQIAWIFKIYIFIPLTPLAPLAQMWPTKLNGKHISIQLTQLHQIIDYIGKNDMDVTIKLTSN